MPKSRNVGTNIKRLRKSGKFKGKQLLAVALSEARAAGNRKIRAPKRKRTKHR
jgi:hypothetical protein